jgi:hypothetical protein
MLVVGMSRRSTAAPRLGALLALLAVSSLLATSCGGSSSADEAKSNACGAVSDIDKQIKQLQGYAVTTVTGDKVKGNLNAIKSDLQTIKKALPDLNSSLKSQLQSATDSFSSQLSSVASTVGKSTSLAGAATQITAAADQLASAYRKAFSSVGC